MHVFIRIVCGIITNMSNPAGEAGQGALFESAGYESMVAGYFGLPPGTMIDPGLRRYVEIDTVPNAPSWYEPAEDGMHVSTGYGVGVEDDFDGFEEWGALLPYPGHLEAPVTGILAGFPTLTDAAEQGKKIECLHLWGDNTDILGSSVAIPIVDIRAVRVFARERYYLEVDLQNMSLGEQSRYDLPALTDTRGGDEIVLRATPDVITFVIAQGFSSPTIEARTVVQGKLYSRLAMEDPATIFQPVE